MKQDKVIIELARFFSTIFSPLVVPGIAMFVLLTTSPLCVLSPGGQFKLLLVTVGITGILPLACIAVLHHLGVVSSQSLIKRHERKWPLVAGTIFYLCAVAYMAYQHQPRWVVMFFAGGALSCLITAIVSHWWKISAHAAASGGLLAMVCALRIMNLEVVSTSTMFMLFCGATLVCGIVGSARIILQRHTVLQVFAGFANGFLSVLMMLLLFG